MKLSAAIICDVHMLRVLKKSRFRVILSPPKRREISLSELAQQRSGMSFSKVLSVYLFGDRVPVRSSVVVKGRVHPRR